LGAVKPSLSEDDDDEEEEYDDDDDIDVTAACLAAVYILCGKLFLIFFLFFIHAPQT
jgi:beta-galactosidase beta subunit